VADLLGGFDDAPTSNSSKQVAGDDFDDFQAASTAAPVKSPSTSQFQQNLQYSTPMTHSNATSGFTSPNAFPMPVNNMTTSHTQSMQARQSNPQSNQFSFGQSGQPNNMQSNTNTSMQNSNQGLMNLGGMSNMNSMQPMSQTNGFPSQHAQSSFSGSSLPAQRLQSPGTAIPSMQPAMNFSNSGPAKNINVNDAWKSGLVQLDNLTVSKNTAAPKTGFSMASGGAARPPQATNANGWSQSIL